MIILILIINMSIKPLLVVKKAINEIATGNADLTKRIPINSKDEIGDVVAGFNKFEEKLHRIVTDIKHSQNTLLEVGSKMNESASETTDSISNVYENIEEMRKQIITQGESVQHTAAAVTQISSNIQSLEKII